MSRLEGRRRKGENEDGKGGRVREEDKGRIRQIDKDVFPDNT